MKKHFLYTFLLLGFFAFARPGAGGGYHGSSGVHYSGSSYHSYGGGYHYHYQESRPLTHEQVVTLVVSLCSVVFVLLVYAAYITYRYYYNGKINQRKIESRRKTDDFWDHDQLIKQACLSYLRLQWAWSKNDLTPIKEELSLRLYRSYTGILNRYRQRGIANFIEDIEITDCRVIYFDDYKDNSRDEVAFLISGQMKDYFSGSGPDATIAKKPFKDACVFIRRNNRLILDEIVNEPDFYQITKPKNYIETTS